MGEINIAEIVGKVLIDMKQHDNHRYESWQNCFTAFATPNLDTDTLALHLGFYLASWGMYRGSGGLLQKSHTVHKGAVEILRLKDFDIIRCSDHQEIMHAQRDIIIDLKNELAGYYLKQSFSKGDKIELVKDTVTLISKIILGTLACTPAFDRYFITGWNTYKEKFTRNTQKRNIATSLSFDKDLLDEIFEFIKQYKPEFLREQKRIQKEYNFHYPLMRMVDMYFWQKGFDIEKEEKARKAREEADKIKNQNISTI